MSKSNAFETALLNLIFNATTYNGIAENDTTSPLTNLYVALHTADPAEGGSQTANEAAYGSYARVAVARTAGGWTISGNAATNAALIQFPQCTSGSESITHASVGFLASGAGEILYSGEISAPLAVAAGIQPQFSAGELDLTED